MFGCIKDITLINALIIILFFLGKTIGDPFACLVIEYDRNISDEELEKLFGEGTFIDGGVSPYDKENMRYDSYYIKLK